MKKLIAILLLTTLLLCSCGTASEDSGKITVVATLFPQYDFAREIAGENADVKLLLDFGADAHSYEPTPADIVTIANADLFIYTGDDMELWAAKLLESADVKKAVDSGSLTVLDLSEHVELICFHEHEHEHEEEHDHSHGEEYDTHIWTSPENAVKMSSAIATSLSDIDAENADKYQTNLEVYTAKLDALSEKMSMAAAAAAHDTAYFGGSFAFAYMFRDMGLSHVSIYEGCASHAEASAADIADMVEKIKASGAKYVLYDSASELKIAESVAAECGAEVLHIHAVHNITKVEFDAGETYISLMEQNVETLRKALS
ncbi:MAG: zinc ABC transporter substrate-binding protein [Clostridia bacterium]|nr:zinc ABC transporter substrate-binding protein [Clostridia bacterium]